MKTTQGHARETRQAVGGFLLCYHSTSFQPPNGLRYPLFAGRITFAFTILSLADFSPAFKDSGERFVGRRILQKLHLLLTMPFSGASLQLQTQTSSPFISTKSPLFIFMISFRAKPPNYVLDGMYIKFLSL
jgi:hypothetical protein